MYSYSTRTYLCACPPPLPLGILVMKKGLYGFVNMFSCVHINVLASHQVAEKHFLYSK